MGEEKATEDLETIAEEVRSCQLCPLARSRTHAVPGEGSVKAGVVFVGEGPGAEEDRQGRPFVGTAGKILNEALSSGGFKRQDIFITNTVKCRPPGNRIPAIEERSACYPYLLKQLEIIKPKIVCLLGKTAMETILGSGSLTMNRGKLIKHSDMNLFVTYHPAAVIYNPDLKRQIMSDIETLKHVLQESV